jgi:hypothetical protein
MSSDDASPQAGQFNNGSSATDAPSRTLPGRNPALAKYNKLQLRQDTIVKPDLFTLYFGFLGTGNWKRKVADVVTTRVENHYVLAARSPSQSELDALVEHGTRSLYYNRIGLPAGSFIGGAWIYGQVRLSPAWPRNPTPMAILNSMRQSTAQNSFKQVAAIAGFRMVVTITLASFVSGVCAAWSDTKNMLTDPRLKGFVDDMRDQKPEDVRKRKLQAASERLRNMRAGEQDIGSQMQQAIGQPGGYVSGSYEEDPNNSFTSSNSYSGFENSNTFQSSDNPTPDQPYKPISNGGPVWAQGRGTQPASEQQSVVDFLDYDDASPTATEHRHTNIDGSSNGSAWDRIRRQNAGGRPQPHQKSGILQPSQNPSSYSEYSRAGQERYGSEQRSEKDQAQANFDKLIDAERNVGSEGSPRNRGWGS